MAADEGNQPMNLEALPYESVAANAVFATNQRSVVRLQIILQGEHKERRHSGYGTGFIVLNTAGHVAVMTVAHSFQDWVKGTMVEVMFHDGQLAAAGVRFVKMQRELALLLVDASARPELLDAARYPPVAFAHADPTKGTFLVMLGYPTNVKGQPEMGSFYGSVINETVTMFRNEADNIGLQLFSADYPAAPGASGSPIFPVVGDDHSLVGLCKGGHRSVSYTVPVSCIRDTLKTYLAAAGAEPNQLENATIREMLEKWLEMTLEPPQPAGDPQAQEGNRPPMQATGGAAIAGPSDN